MKNFKNAFTKSFLILIIFQLFIFTAFAQSDLNFDLGGLNSGDISRARLQDLNIQPVSVSAADKGGDSLSAKEWTIMIYMNGKNSLQRAAFENINEMEKVGSSAEFNVVVEFGQITKEGYFSLAGNWTGSKRYYIEKDSDLNEIASPALENRTKVNMGDWRHLVDFVKWAKAKYPAKHYALIVWNHGSGWLEDNPVSSPKGISYDDETGNNIDTPQLGMALGKMGKIDVFAADACFMQMASVAYELKDYVEYIVGSEDITWGKGYGYEEILKALAINPKISSLDLSIKIVDTYMPSANFLNAQSVINVKKLQYLPVFTDDFVKAAMSANLKTEAEAAKNKAQGYANSDNKDFYHFVKLMVEATSDETVKDKGKMLMNFIKSGLIAYTPASIAPNSNGIAVYFPMDKYDENYNKLKWSKDSQWDEFIKWQLITTSTTA
ncbi:MAG: clostripain-related cysteine peptidase [Elusimicrobia bacterium]|nr:clostripain-related cysteine peptidase [Elusimicrobiota bacterium]